MNWLLLKSGSGDTAFNMAMDEALLEALPRLGKPVLRFYGWNQPAASFGYFQKFSEVERATALRPLIRRPTGGGLVPHDADWTYSLTFPAGHEWHSLAATESYRRVHEWIQRAFEKLGVASELAPCCKRTGSSRHEEAHFKNGKNQSILTSAATSECFDGFEKSDLLWRGKKIAGAAQRRNKLGLLIQGSVQPPTPSLPHADWMDAMCAVASLNGGVEWLSFEPDDLLKERANELSREKYAVAAYNQRR